MVKEKEDIEFDDLLAARRHKELSDLLKDLKLLLEKPADTSMSSAIEKHIGAINDLAKILSNQKEIVLKSPDVNVSVGTEQVVSSVQQLSLDLLEELKKFNSRPLVTSFRPIYTYGNVSSIEVVYDSSNKLNYKK